MKKKGTKKSKIVSYTLNQIRKMKSKTDWAQLDAMKDEDIDCSDIPELTDEFWEKAIVVRPGEFPLFISEFKRFRNESYKITPSLKRDIKELLTDEDNDFSPRLRDFLENVIEHRVY